MSDELARSTLSLLISAELLGQPFPEELAEPMKNLLLTIGKAISMVGASASFVGLAYFQWFAYSIHDYSNSIVVFGAGMLIFAIGLVLCRFSGASQTKEKHSGIDT